MASLTAAAVCVLCAAHAPAMDRMARWEPYIAEASTRFGLPESWIAAVMRAESGGRTTLDGEPITSSAGAMGLMQIMPNTYAGLRERYGFGPDAYDPHDNILAGAAYLRALYQRYGYPDLFAAYNAGPGRFDSYLSGQSPLPSETKSYLRRIIPSSAGATGAVERLSKAPVHRSGNALFFLLTSGHKTTDSVWETPSSQPAMPGDLFIPLSAVAR